MATVALVAGGGADTAIRLGLSMTALQCSIGALNDLRDAERDVGRIPPKPIPAGQVTRPVAWGVVVGAALAGVLAGVLLAASHGVAVAGLAVLVLAIGYVYDLFAKGTAGSWLPFAIGIPVLPLYGWFGAAGSVPSFFVALMPMATLAGAALAMANALADLERDRAAGTVSIATTLGSERAWWVHAALWVAVLAIALGSLILEAAPTAGIAGVLVIGVVLAGAMQVGRGGDGARRERAWELEAIAAAAALVTWLVALLA